MTVATPYDNARDHSADRTASKGHAAEAGLVEGRPRVIVAGGGIAGITAAVGLADAGWAVDLVETRKRLGGRATSFVDPRTGETLDNCQHVALRCCTAYRALCARLGVEELLRWDDTQWWIEAGGRVSTIRPSRLPAPVHYLPSFARARFLTLREKLAVAFAMDRIRRADRERYRGITFGELLKRWHQPAGAVAKFWDAVIVGACNLPPSRVCAASALYVFQEGFLSTRDAGVMGISTVPLVRLYDRAVEVIEASGGRVRLGASVTSLDSGGVTLADGRVLAADRVVCALPFERAVRAVPDSVQKTDPRFAAMGHLEHSPILGVHLEFDRPVLDTPHCVLVDRPTHWLFRKDESGARVHAVISAAEGWMDLDERAIVDRVLADIAACLPSRILNGYATGGADLAVDEDTANLAGGVGAGRGSVGRARLIGYRSVKEKRATFAPTVDAERARSCLVPEGPSGILLAGDCTDTGWPATMEGAARSGAAVVAALA